MRETPTLQGLHLLVENNLFAPYLRAEEIANCVRTSKLFCKMVYQHHSQDTLTDGAICAWRSGKFLSWKKVGICEPAHFDAVRNYINTVSVFKLADFTPEWTFLPFEEIVIGSHCIKKGVGHLTSYEEVYDNVFCDFDCLFFELMPFTRSVSITFRLTCSCLVPLEAFTSAGPHGSVECIRVYSEPPNDDQHDFSLLEKCYEGPGGEERTELVLPGVKVIELLADWGSTTFYDLTTMLSTSLKVEHLEKLVVNRTDFTSMTFMFASAFSYFPSLRDIEIYASCFPEDEKDVPWPSVWSALNQVKSLRLHLYLVDGRPYDSLLHKVLLQPIPRGVDTLSIEIVGLFIKGTPRPLVSTELLRQYTNKSSVFDLTVRYMEVE